MKTLMLYSLLFVGMCAMFGCTDKNYARKKPAEGELMGSWRLGTGSVSAVSKAYHLDPNRFKATIEIEQAGIVKTDSIPVLGVKSAVGLVTGAGTWSVEKYGEVWRLVLNVGGNVLPFDVGRDGEKIFLNRPIDDPDGEVMRFTRIE